MLGLLSPRLCLRARPGLTMLELLVVLVAIGILVALAAFGYGQAMERAYRAAMLNDLRNFATARGLYASEQESYPATVEAVGNHNYTESVFEIDYWNGGAFYHLVVGHRKTETVCSVTEYEGEGYWIGCERRNQLEFEANPGAGPLDIQFDATAGIAAVGITPSDIQRVAWSYGNGKTSSGGAEHQTPTHAYEQQGRYRVQLVVIPKSGRMRVGYREVQLGTVDGTPPVAEFDLYEVVEDTTTAFQASEPEEPSLLSRFAAYAAETLTATVEVDSVYGDTIYLPVGAKVELDGTPSFDPAGRNIVSYKWSFAGLSTRLDGEVVRHLWNTEPSVTLTVTNDLGLTHSRTRYIKFIDGGQPYADFFWSPKPADRNAPVLFDASKSYHTGIRALVRYRWQFADGDTAMGPRVTRRFDAPGTQEVTLTVTDDRGGSASQTQTVTILGSTLVADWDFCRSYGSGTIHDEVSGLHLPLVQNQSSTPTGWERYWRSGPPAHLQMDSASLTRPHVSGYLASPGRSTGSYTLVFLVRPRGAQSFREYFFGHAGASGSKQIYLAREPDGKLLAVVGGSSAYLGTLPGDEWSTVAFQLRPVSGSTTYTAEGFVNGVSTGTFSVASATPLKGALYVGRSDYSSYLFTGAMSSARYYEGAMTSEEVRQVQDALLAQTTTGGCVLNNQGEAQFTHTPLEPYVGEAVRFDASTSMGFDSETVRYQWSWGDGSSEEQASPFVSHSYASAGAYTVTLTVTDRQGKTATAQKRIDVYTRSVLHWNWNFCASYGGAAVRNTAGAGGNLSLVQFQNPSPIPWSNYWRAGPPPHLQMDSTSLVRPHVSGYLAAPGRTENSYTLMFLLKPKSGLINREYFFGHEWASGSQRLHLAREPDGTFYFVAGNASAYLGNLPAHEWSTVAVQIRPLTGTSQYMVEGFINGVSTGGRTMPSTPLLGNLYFGRSEPATANSPGYFFSGSMSSARYYEGFLPPERLQEAHQELMATVTTGCAVVENVSSEARFTYTPEQPYVAEPVQFDASTSALGSTSIASYTWDYGDWVVETTSTPTVSHTYTAAGTYSVRLTVTGENGVTASVTRSFEVRPQASFVAHWDACASWRTATLQDTRSGYHFALSQLSTPTSPWSAYWPKQDPAHLVLGDASLPRLSAKAAAPGRTENSYTLMFLLKPKNGLINREYFFGHEWASGSQQLNLGREPDGTFYFAAGNATAYLGKLPADQWSTVAVQIRPLTGTSQYMVEGFINGVSTGGRTMPSTPLLGNLYFGRSEPTTANNPAYFFSGAMGSARYYEGNLTQERLREIHQEMISASCTFPPRQDPTADFTWTPNPATSGDWITFNGESSTDPDGHIVSYQWTFRVSAPGPDGSLESHVLGTAKGKVVHFQYNTSYPEGATAELEVTDNDGGKARTSRLVLSTEVPEFRARFSWTPEAPAVSQSTLFDASTSLSPNPIAKYTWTLGGAGSGGADVVYSGASYQSLSFSFSRAGVYPVTLKIHDSNNDSTSATHEVAVGQVTGADPVAHISYSPASGLVAGDTVTFDGTRSYDPDGTIASHSWSFSGGGSATSGVVKVVFQGEGTHPVKLVVKDDEGRTGEATVSVVIGPKLIVENEPPVAVLEIEHEPVYVGQSLRFNGWNSYDPDNLEGPPPAAQFLLAEWKIDNGDWFSFWGMDTHHAFSTPGTHSVALRVTDRHGAQHQVSRSIEVLEKPRYSIRIEPKDQYVSWQSCDEVRDVKVKATLIDLVTGQAVNTGLTRPLYWTLLSGQAGFPANQWSGSGWTQVIRVKGSTLVNFQVEAWGAKSQGAIRAQYTYKACDNGWTPLPPPPPPVYGSGPKIASLSITSGPSSISLNLEDKTAYTVTYIAKDAKGNVLKGARPQFRLVRGTYQGKIPSPMGVGYPLDGSATLTMWGPTDAHGSAYIEAYISNVRARWPVTMYCGLSTTGICK